MSGLSGAPLPELPLWHTILRIKLARESFQPDPGVGDRLLDGKAHTYTQVGDKHYVDGELVKPRNPKETLPINFKCQSCPATAAGGLPRFQAISKKCSACGRTALEVTTANAARLKARNELYAHAAKQPRHDAGGDDHSDH